MRALPLCLLLMLTACAAQPKMEKLPYRFTISSLNDARPAEEFSGPQPYPFRQTAFLKEMQRALPYSLFGSETGNLDLTLTHFEATSFDGNYALSMVMEMAGRDQWDRELVSRPVMCSEVQSRGFELQDYAQQVWRNKNLQALTPEAREDKMWNNVFAACVRSLGRQFGQALVQRQTATTKE